LILASHTIYTEIRCICARQSRQSAWRCGRCSAISATIGTGWHGQL